MHGCAEVVQEVGLRACRTCSCISLEAVFIKLKCSLNVIGLVNLFDELKAKFRMVRTISVFMYIHVCACACVCVCVRVCVCETVTHLLKCMFVFQVSKKLEDIRTRYAF